MTGVARLTRKVSFSSGHRYWRADWDEAQNRLRFGRWASRFNHGHNYVLWVTAEGRVDPATGMVVNIKLIDDLLQAEVVAKFDQKSLNDEVAAFGKLPPTLENLVKHLSERLLAMPGGVALTAIKLEETPTLYAEWRLDLPMTTLTRTYEFAASHRLHLAGLTHDENIRLFGKCNNPNGHGHNYVLEVTVDAEPDEATGMGVDIDRLDQVVLSEVVDRYDHKNLDLDVPELRGKNTTSEIVSQAIYARLDGKVPAKLRRIRLFETARNVFEVAGD